jgi:hypothetical protein
LTRTPGDEASRAFYLAVDGRENLGNLCIEGSRPCLDSERRAIMEERRVGDSALFTHMEIFHSPLPHPPFSRYAKSLAAAGYCPTSPPPSTQGMMAKLRVAIRVAILEYFSWL